MTPESKVKVKVKNWLAKNASWYTAISDRYTSGLPDFHGLLKTPKGRPVYIEVKSLAGRVSQKQWQIANSIIEAGGVFYIASPDEKCAGEVSFWDLSQENSRTKWYPGKPSKVRRL